MTTTNDEKLVFAEETDDLVAVSCGEFGDYYVSREKRDRSRELKAALAALEVEDDMERDRR